MLAESREKETTITLNGPELSYKPIKFGDILEYVDRFPEDVDDLRVFIKMVQAIDSEFLEHGIRKGDTPSSS